MVQKGTRWPFWLLLHAWAHLFMYGRDACATFLLFPSSRVLIMIISVLIIEMWWNGIWPRLLIQIVLLCCLTIIWEKQFYTMSRKYWRLSLCLSKLLRVMTVLSVDWSGLTIFASDRGTKLRRRLEIKVGVDDDIGIYAGIILSTTQHNLASWPATLQKTIQKENIQHASGSSEASFYILHTIQITAFYQNSQKSRRRMAHSFRTVAWGPRFGRDWNNVRPQFQLEKRVRQQTRFLFKAECPVSCNSKRWKPARPKFTK